MGGVQRYAIIGAAVIVLAGIVRIPNGDQMRAITRLTTETIMILGFATILFLVVNKWLACFVILVSITAMFPAFDRFAHWRREAVLFGAAWYVYVYLFVDNPDYWLLNSICIVVLANIVVIAFQVNELDPYHILSGGLMSRSFAPSTIKSQHITGLMFNINEASALLGVSAPLFLRSGWKKYIPLVAIGLIATKSTVGIAAVAAGVLVYLIKKKKYGPIACVVAALPAYAFLWDKNLKHAVTWRLEQIWTAVRIASDHPFGVGPGHWHLATNQLHAHSDVFQAVAESGFLAMVIIIGFSVSLYLKLSPYNAMILAGIIMISICSFMWFIPTTALIMTTLLAVIDRSPNA